MWLIEGGYIGLIECEIVVSTFKEDHSSKLIVLSVRSYNYIRCPFVLLRTITQEQHSAVGKGTLQRLGGAKGPIQSDCLGHVLDGC